MNKFIKIVSGIALIFSMLATSVLAADYPSRPVKFIVPWPPGDLEDVLTRIIAQEMAKQTGKPATVINKPGGAAVIGTAEVAKAKPDGLTIGSFVIDLLTFKILNGSAPWGHDTFEPVGIFLDYPFVIATRSDSPYNSMEELAEYSQKNKISLGHFGYPAGPTATTFKAAEALGINFSSDAPFEATDCSVLSNGDADVINTTTQLILACLKSGDVKILTSFTSTRLSIAPNVPTLKELTGFSGTTWNGLFVPKGTPESIKYKIGLIAKKALNSEKVRKIAKTTGASVYWQDSKQASERIALDLEDSRDLLKYMNK